MDRLTNKVTLITGAASGIGKATAELFHREGAIIILSDINHKAGSEITKKLKKRATYFHLDVSKEEDWKTDNCCYDAKLNQNEKYT